MKQLECYELSKYVYIWNDGELCFPRIQYFWITGAHKCKSVINTYGSFKEFLFLGEGI